MTTPPIHVGNTDPYRAANGHTMTAPIYRMKSGAEREVSAWARCTPDCDACAGGDWLPDY